MERRKEERSGTERREIRQQGKIKTNRSTCEQETKKREMSTFKGDQKL